MKKKMKKFTAVIAPVLAMSMALTACSGSGGEKKTTTTSSGGGDEKKSEIKYAARASVKSYRKPRNSDDGYF